MITVSKELEVPAGTTLEALLLQRAGHRLPPAEALDLFAQLLAVLAEAHGRGTLHGNITPACILVRGGGGVQLTDFGDGPAAAPAAQTLSSLLLGHPAYMSPEQLRSAAVDHRTDLYSAAVVLFEMLAGRPPFQDKADRALIQRHLTEIPPDLSTLVPGLPAGVGKAVAIALRKEPQERFPTAGDFLRALREGMAGLLPLDPRLVTATAPESDVPALEETAAIATPRAPRHWSPRLAAAAWVLVGLNLAVTYGIWEAWHHEPVPSPPPGTPTPAPSLPPVVTPPPPAEETPTLSTSPPEEVSTPPDTPKEVVVTPVLKPSPSSPGPDPAEIRSREVARAREEIRQGLAQAGLDLQGESFDAAQTKLDDLMEQAQRYPDAMQEEIRQVKDLRAQLIDARVAAKTRVREEEIRRAALEQKLQDIQILIQKGRYPEAINQAKDLSEQPGVPADVASRAREMSVQANEGLKNVWGDTQMGPTENKLRKKPPKNEKRRFDS